MIRSGNPVLSDKIFNRNSSPALRMGSGAVQDVMTLDGAVNKTGLSILITAAAAYYSFTHPEVFRYYIPFLIGTLICALVISFKPKTAPYLTPLYAAVEGLMLGAISMMFEMRYPGIVFQAVTLTFGTLFALLMAYKSGWIKATENFKLGVFAATGAIGLLYLTSFILSFFGIQMGFMHNSSLLSIGISCVIVVVAALNLVMDFDFIENAAASKSAPKYMEWYAAFGLLVTLVWLYVEFLRLLSKINDRK